MTFQNFEILGRHIKSFVYNTIDHAYSFDKQLLIVREKLSSKKRKLTETERWEYVWVSIQQQNALHRGYWSVAYFYEAGNAWMLQVNRYLMKQKKNRK